MKKMRKLFKKPAVTIGLLVIAVALLLGSSISGIRAELVLESEDYKSQVKLSSVKVALIENGEQVAKDGALLSDLLERAEDTKLHIGKKYDENLRVKNTGTADEYVRVTVYKYWIDEEGKKFPEIDSAYIVPGFVTGEGWTIDEDSVTEERTVLYYSEILKPGDLSTPFMESIKVDDAITVLVDQTTTTANGVTTITTTFRYNGKSICLEVYADAVQTHSENEAKTSAWGVAK
ncbi:MAG: hypothetical protein IJJ48_07665 [Firmicutes bacterium]|nr:hypothetical protein [Bacillota bacterium]